MANSPPTVVGPFPKLGFPTDHSIALEEGKANGSQEFTIQAHSAPSNFQKVTSNLTAGIWE